jgi:hypothetical protein
MAGVVLVAVSSGLPDIVQTASAGVRDLAIVGMGASLLFARRERIRHGVSHDLAQVAPRSTRTCALPRRRRRRSTSGTEAAGRRLEGLAE